MRVAFIALFAQLSCILAFIYREDDLYNEGDLYGFEKFGVDSETSEPSDYLDMIQMLQTAKRLGTARSDRGRVYWDRRLDADTFKGRRGERPGVDYFRKEYDFFPDEYSLDSQWLEVAQKEAAMAQPVKRDEPVAAKEETKEEHLLALIVKSEYNNKDKCKTKLEEYCKELKKTDPKLEKVHDKVKEFCENGKQEEKCRVLKNKVGTELDSLKKGLEEALKEINDEKCKEHEEKCLFLEEADPTNLKESCTKLRDECYKEKRHEVTQEILSRGLKVVVNDINKCEEGIKKVCQRLSEYNDELMLLCLDPNETCKELKSKLKDVCKPLEVELKDNELKEKCQEYLENCYFYGSSCANTKCESIKKKCEGEGIKYEAPGSNFNPVEREAGLSEKIGLKSLYKKAEVEGIIIRRPGEKTLQDVVLLLSYPESGGSGETKCKEALEKCNKFEYLGYRLNELCKEASKNKDKECKELVNVDEKCKKLKLELYLIGLSTTEAANTGSDILEWSKLPTLFSEQECIELESECFYLERACPTNLKEACRNLRLACYKKGQDRALNRLFESGLKDLKYLDYAAKKVKCQKSVVDSCTKLKEDKKYFPKCLQPGELCSEIIDDIILQSEELGRALDEARDYPERKDCVELKKRCDDLKSNSYLNDDKCTTLNRRCEYLTVSEEFRKRFLKRDDDALETHENCMKALKEECDRLSRRGKNAFSVSCSLPEETCDFMIAKTNIECFTFKDRVENENTLKNGKNGTLIKEVCVSLAPYYDEYVEVCSKILKEKSSGKEKTPFLKLEEKCGIFFKDLQLEDSLVDELKGSLTDEAKCKERLGTYCTMWEKGTNQTLNGLCKDKSDPNNDVKAKVCKKLLENVKRRCPNLQSDLEKAKDELKEKKDEYDKVKQEAEGLTNKAKLVLSKSKKSEGVDAPAKPAVPATPGSQGPPAPPTAPGTSEGSGTPAGVPSTPGGTTNTTDGKTNVTLVRRAFIAGMVSEAETKAFDATARALELYLELEEDCRDLQAKCGFKEECSDTKSACKEIETLCGEVKPLEVKPHHEEVSTVTTTSTTTTTSVTTKTTTATETKTKTETKSIGEGKVTEECTLIRTTDTWVTKTSLHTSTTTSTSTVTQTVTLTSTRKCKPTKCTTDSSKETQKEEEEEVKPNEGMKMRVPGVIKIMLLGVIVMGMM